MNYQDRIISDPNVMLGKPVIKGTRITIELILRKLGEGSSFERLLDGYPQLKNDDILAALQYASDVVSDEYILPLAG